VSPTEIEYEHADEEQATHGQRSLQSGSRRAHVRFAPSAATRQERRDQLRRDRATAPVLRAAFPTIKQLRIELTFEGPNSSTPTPQSHLLYPPAPAFFGYACPYSDCDGQFNLGDAVKAALADATHRAEGQLECRGSRVGDHASKRPCLLRLVYEVTATFQRQS
jgi:hypothetical protein